MARTSRHLVVDGSNIATESRTLPSLGQLDEAVRAAQSEYPDWQVTVIVDATFAHRIDASERKAFEEANDAGEIVMPPAGAVGRGDAFILQVAEKAGAAVLSNDSFQEFHGEHPWLFEEGRLIGGKPVAEIGWVFVPRVPVRGPASRRATRSTRDAKKSKGSRSGTSQSRQSRQRTAAQGPAPKPTASTPPPSRGERRSKGDESPSDRRKGQRRSTKSPQTDKPKTKNQAKEQPKKSAKAANKSEKKSQGKSKGKGNLEALNSPRDFMMFVTRHSLGDEIEAVVDRFSSHGCYLRASSAQCYLPSSAMGDPPPTRARDVVALGQTIIVRVESIDSDRRGINVVLVRVVKDDGKKQGKTSAGNSRGKKVSKTSQQQASVADESAREANLTRSTTIVATKKSAKKARKKPAKKATAKKAAKATSSARATKAAARRTAKKSSAKKATAKKAVRKTTAKKATKKTAKKATAKKAAKKSAKKATAKRAPAKKAAKKAAKKTAKRAPAKKAAKKAAKKTAKRAPAKKATARKAAKKSAKKATAKRAPAKKAAKKR